MLENLDIDIDALLEQENFVELLIEKYGFNNNSLDKFAELIYDFIVFSKENNINREKMINAINSIYRYLAENDSTLSLDRYYILKELEKYKV